MAKNTNPRSTTKDDVIIGMRIRAARLQAEKSMEWLGGQLGITWQQQQKQELGKNRTGAARLARISVLLEQPLSYFFEGITTFDGRAGKGSVEMTQFLSMPHAHELAGAYQRIADPGKRAVLLNAAKALAA